MGTGSHTPLEDSDTGLSSDSRLGPTKQRMPQPARWSDQRVMSVQVTMMMGVAFDILQVVSRAFHHDRPLHPSTQRPDGIFRPKGLPMLVSAWRQWEQLSASMHRMERWVDQGGAKLSGRQASWLSVERERSGRASTSTQAATQALLRHLLSTQDHHTHQLVTGYDAGYWLAVRHALWRRVEALTPQRGHHGRRRPKLPHPSSGTDPEHWATFVQLRDRMSAERAKRSSQPAKVAEVFDDEFFEQLGQKLPREVCVRLLSAHPACSLSELLAHYPLITHGTFYRRTGWSAKALIGASSRSISRVQLAEDLLKAGYQPSDCRHAGLSARVMRHLGVGASTLFLHGYDEAALRHAGFDAPTVKAALDQTALHRELRLALRSMEALESTVRAHLGFTFPMTSSRQGHVMPEASSAVAAYEQGALEHPQVTATRWSDAARLATWMDGVKGGSDPQRRPASEQEAASGLGRVAGASLVLDRIARLTTGEGLSTSKRTATWERLQTTWRKGADWPTRLWKHGRRVPLSRQPKQRVNPWRLARLPRDVLIVGAFASAELVILGMIGTFWFVPAMMVVAAIGLQVMHVVRTRRAAVEALNQGLLSHRLRGSMEASERIPAQALPSLRVMGDSPRFAAAHHTLVDHRMWRERFRKVPGRSCLGPSPMMPEQSDSGSRGLVPPSSPMV